jgi:hypothetical protein
MISRTPTLAEWPYRVVRLACDLCPRETPVARRASLKAQLVDLSAEPMPTSPTEFGQFIASEMGNGAR